MLTDRCKNGSVGFSNTDTIIAKCSEFHPKRPQNQTLGKRDTIIGNFSNSWYRRNGYGIFILMPPKIPSEKISALFLAGVWHLLQIVKSLIYNCSYFQDSQKS